jgi:LmbE family N-acetylglucosaminyl deacetylase
MTPQRLSEIKKKEQEEAAGFLGEREVCFLDYVDGNWLPTSG